MSKTDNLKIYSHLDKKQDFSEYDLNGFGDGVTGVYCRSTGGQTDHRKNKISAKEILFYPA